MLTNLPISYDLCVGVPILHINSVLNVKALVATFNQKALVGAFSVIEKLQCLRRFVFSSSDDDCGQLLAYLLAKEVFALLTTSGGS